MPRTTYTWSQFKSLEQEAADLLQKEWSQIFSNTLFHFMHQLVFVQNPNGSWEAWPIVEPEGVSVWCPKEKMWGLSDYADDEWLDSATGMTDWRDHAEDPNE